MKSKLTTITPVHISTGDIKMPYEYNSKGHVLNNYRIEDIFSCIPDQELIDYRFLNGLRANKEGSQRNKLHQQLRRFVNYQTLEPAYTLEYNFDEPSKENVSVQIKSLNQPIIPGSTIKGAIFTGVLYDWFKNRLLEIIQSDTESFQIDKLIINYYNNRQVSDFIKQMRQCLLCADVPLTQMVYLKTSRRKIQADSNVVIPLPDVECIQSQQSYDGHVIQIDQEKRHLLNKQYADQSFYNDFIGYLEESTLIQVINNYFKDMIEEELVMDGANGYYRQSQINELLETLTSPLDNGFYLRLGHHTNYFFKTISYIVRKDNATFYQEHFDQYFSPKPSKIKGAHPKAEEMPVTRTLYYDDQGYYYPGVVKIEFYNED